MTQPNGIITAGKIILTDQFRNDDTLSRFRVSQPTTVFEMMHQNNNDFHRKMSTSTNGTASFNLNLTKSIGEMTTYSTGDKVISQSYQYITHQPGQSKISHLSFCLNPDDDSTSGLYARVGLFDDANDKLVGNDASNGNGYFIQLNDGELSFVERNSASGVSVDIQIPQSEWNVDTLLGDGSESNSSELLIDSSKNTILVIQQDCNGSGITRLGFIIQDVFVVAHKFYNSHIQTLVLPVRFELLSESLESNYILHCISASVQIEGGSDISRGLRYTNISNSNHFFRHKFTPVFSIRLSASGTRKKLLIKQVNVLAEESKNAIQWKLLQNTTLTGAVFTDGNLSSDSEIDTTATAYTGGMVIAGGYCAKHIHFNRALFDIEGILPITSEINGTSQIYTVIAMGMHDSKHSHKSSSDDDDEHDLSVSVEWIEGL